MKLEFLPAYLPDFNLIELAFSHIKSAFRWGVLAQVESESDHAICLQLYGVVMSLPAENCQSFFCHLGYI